MTNEPIDLESRRDGPIRVYGQEEREPKQPFRFRLGNSPEMVVYEPDSGTVMDIEECGTTRKALRLFLGDGYAQLEEYLEPMHPDVMVELARDMSRHFGLFDTQPSVNRAEQRRRRRRQ